MLRVIGFDHVVLRVRDLDRALGFYRDVLGLRIELLEEYRKGLRPFVSARAGEQLIDLVPDPTYDPKEGSSKGGLLQTCGDPALVERARSQRDRRSTDGAYGSAGYGTGRLCQRP